MCLLILPLGLGLTPLHQVIQHLPSSPDSTLSLMHRAATYSPWAKSHLLLLLAGGPWQLEVPGRSLTTSLIPAGAPLLWTSLLLTLEVGLQRSGYTHSSFPTGQSQAPSALTRISSFCSCWTRSFNFLISIVSAASFCLRPTARDHIIQSVPSNAYSYLRQQTVHEEVGGEAACQGMAEK